MANTGPHSSCLIAHKTLPDLAVEHSGGGASKAQHSCRSMYSAQHRAQQHKGRQRPRHPPGWDRKVCVPSVAGRI